MMDWHKNKQGKTMLKLNKIDNKGSTHQVSQDIIKSERGLNLICTTFTYGGRDKEHLYHVVRDDKTVLGEFKDYMDAVRCMDSHVLLEMDSCDLGYADFSWTTPNGGGLSELI